MATFAMILLCGCGSGDTVPVPGSLSSLLTDAKALVAGVDYLVSSSSFDRTEEVFSVMSHLIDEDCVAEFGEYAEQFAQLQKLAREVKELLLQETPKVEEAKPKIEDMKKIANGFPGHVRLSAYWDFG